MVMTPQQARMAAIRLRAAKPELQSVAIDDLVAQIMASESEAAPGAGVGTLANLFPTMLSPASPAPMRAAELEAPKPTAMIIPNAARSGPAIPVGAGPRSANPPLADWQKEHLARMQAGLAMPEGEAAPVVAAEVAPEVVAEAPEAPKFTSRFGPMLRQKEAELEQLKASVPRTGEIPPELTIGLDVLSREVAQLKGLVAAEEGAAVNPERAAILERQTKRLGREEELVEQARRRAPFDALIAGGAALAGARPGESFASALARGLQAGSQTYRGALDAREASLRGIEERRDAFALQSIDAVQKARDEAIALQNAGLAMTEQQMRLAGMTREDATAAAIRPFAISEAKSKASKAQTEADTAAETIEAENILKRAQAGYYTAGGGRGGGGGGGTSESKPLSATNVTNRDREYRIRADKAFEAAKNAWKAKNKPGTYRALQNYGAIRAEYNKFAAENGLPPLNEPDWGRNFEGYTSQRGKAKPAAKGNAGKPPVPAAKGNPGKPPVPGAKWSDSPTPGWFIKDPNRPGKYLQVFNKG